MGNGLESSLKIIGLHTIGPCLLNRLLKVCPIWPYNLENPILKLCLYPDLLEWLCFLLDLILITEHNCFTWILRALMFNSMLKQSVLVAKEHSKVCKKYSIKK